MPSRTGETGLGTAARVPEREHVDAVVVWRNPVVEVVVNAGKVNATNTDETDVPGDGSDARMNRKKTERPFELIGDG